MLKVLDRDVLAYLNVQYGRVTKRFQRADFVKLSENTGAPQATNEQTRSTSCAQVHYSPFPSYPFPNSIDLEDCLFVNIWSPVDENTDAFRPVVVVLAGGNFNAGGSGDNEFYDGSNMAALWNQVVVIPNYRVGLFGFLNELAVNVSENVGITDQQLLTILRAVQVHAHTRPVERTNVNYALQHGNTRTAHDHDTRQKRQVHIGETSVLRTPTTPTGPNLLHVCSNQIREKRGAAHAQCRQQRHRSDAPYGSQSCAFDSTCRVPPSPLFAEIRSREEPYQVSCSKVDALSPPRASNARRCYSPNSVTERVPEVVIHRQKKTTDRRPFSKHWQAATAAAATKGDPVRAAQSALRTSPAQHSKTRMDNSRNFPPNGAKVLPRPALVITK
ncbi:hypothetical protein HPB47_009260 [Ixodes persulcatus]|uniref:Uncharacterized protein n=1 Tax=Ixodes persulcatus TaxID=34615 RepID=A0AC60P2S6_IXOPE|nr:hypothetical protein HPB47_009260 [Ixodes persulcatus]